MLIKMLLLNFYINILIEIVIERYHVNQRCLLLFADDDLNYSGDIPSIKLKVVNGTADYKLIFNYFGCQSVIIYASDPMKMFVEFESQIHHNLERFNMRRYLLIARNGSNNLEKEFFQLKELYFVADLLLVTFESLSDDSFVFELKTHKFVGASHQNEPLVRDWWFTKNLSFLYDNNLYPDKLTNQMGRPLKMAVFPYEPYSVIGRSVEEHQGSELVSAVQFGLKYNMTPVPVINEKDYWGEIFPNWSGNGLLGNLVEDNADLGFSALYTWEICYHYLDLSKPLVRTGITCLVPAPSLTARWLTPLISYSPQIWICFVVIFVVSIIILSVMLFCYHHNKSMLQAYSPHSNWRYPKSIRIATKIVIKPILLQPLARNEIPVELSSKFMMLLIQVLSLLLASTYSSGLASVMTLPRYDHAINTVEEFAASGFDWGATQDAWITSIQTAEDPKYVQIVSKFHPTPEEDFREFSKTGKWAFSIERLPSENFAVGDYIKEDVIDNFHLMQQDLYWEQCVIMLRKNSVLLPLLDLFILRIFEAGLISQWQNRAVETSMNPHVQRAVRYYTHHLQEREVIKLKWSHVEGAFAVLIIGHLVSFVVFIFEIVLYRKEAPRKIFIN